MQEDAYGGILKRYEDIKSKPRIKKHALTKLCPIVIQGLLCVGGRLGNSEYPSQFKHPVILPTRHVVTELIIRYHHVKEGHTGTQQVLASMRSKYWIVKGNSAVRRVIGQCVSCRRYLANIGQQMMAPLPLCRVQKGWRCFKFVGIDYFETI